MPYGTYYKLFSTSLTGSSVTFDNLNTFATTYKDLIFLINARSTNASNTATMTIQLNNNTSNAHSVTAIRIDDTVNNIMTQSSSNNPYITELPADTGDANFFATTYLYFPKIDSSTFQGFFYESSSPKTLVTTGKAWIGRGFVASVSALTSVTLTTTTGFNSNSEITIYGIARS